MVLPRSKRQRVNLTIQRIAALTCVPGKGEAILWDAMVSGLGVRAYPSGRKTYFVQYRIDGGGRKAQQRRLALVSVRTVVAVAVVVDGVRARERRPVIQVVLVPEMLRAPS